MKLFVVSLSLIFIFAVTYIAFDANSKKESKESKEVTGTSSMEHSFHTMKDSKGSLGTTPDYSKVAGNKDGEKKNYVAPQYKPTTSGVEDYTIIGDEDGIKNPNLPGAVVASDDTKAKTSTKAKEESTTITSLTTRQQYVITNGLPEKYKNIKSPFPSDQSSIKAGMTLFNSRCKACHGIDGYGDGPAGASLKPKPSDLSQVVATNIATDGYLLWALTEGGSPLGTGMISLKTLPEEQRWNIIHYLRAEIAKK